MLRSTVLLLLVVSIGMLSGRAFAQGNSGGASDDDRTAREKPDVVKTIPGWGDVIDPDGDCTIEASGDRLTISVPSGTKDIWYGTKDPTAGFNAPRVLQNVKGDFTLTVRVTADWFAGLDQGGFNAGGILIWESGQQYLRLERNHFASRQNKGKARLSYTTPLYDLNNRRTFYNSTLDEFFKGRSTWLRVIRRGKMIRTMMSHDKKKWTWMGFVSTEFPEEVQVGVSVISSTKVPTEVVFDDFSLEK